MSDRAGRQYVAGVDGDGRSTVALSDAPATERAAGALTVRSLWSSAVLTPGRGAGVPAMDVGVEPGASRAIVSGLAHGYDSGLHRTTTVDLSVVLAGTVDFHVDTGMITLRAGDCVVVPGVLHRWHARQADCTLAVVLVGARPAASDEGTR